MHREQEQRWPYLPPYAIVTARNKKDIRGGRNRLHIKLIRGADFYRPTASRMMLLLTKNNSATV